MKQKGVYLVVLSPHGPRGPIRLDNALDLHDLLQGIILKDTPPTRPKSKFGSKRLNAFRERSKFDHRQLQHLSLIQAFTALPLYQAHIH
uniref:Uncharacterized protein n=1 Tax=Romanomermis culicivorax TaxID=13658 RepID=A0A915KKD0_ROMCU